MTDYSETISDALNYVDDNGLTAGWTANGSLADSGVIGAPGGDVTGWSYQYLTISALADLLLGSESFSPQWQPGATFEDFIRLTDVYNINGTWHLSLSDKALLSDLFGTALSVLLNDGVSLSFLQQVVLATGVLDALTCNDTLLPQMTYMPVCLETILFSPTLQLFLGASWVDEGFVSDTLSESYGAFGLLQESISIEDIMGPSLLATFVIDETVNFDDTTALQAFFNQTISDKVCFAAIHLEPSGGITTWAMNARTGAVTEYTRYAFNSFAKMGDKYIGASDTGLFELDGPADSGHPVIARIGGGLLQLAGSRFTSFNGAYLGLRGAGEFFLKLTSGENHTYVYKIKAHSLQTAKINLGKGLRSRYFRWELESVGQDFDLDTVEFVPISSIRRV